MNTKRLFTKRKAIAIVAGVAVVAAVSASAATLGGISTMGIGANSNVVQSPIEGGLVASFGVGADGSVWTADHLHLEPIDPTEEITDDMYVVAVATGANGEVLGEYAGGVGTGDLEYSGSGSVHIADVVGVSVVVMGINVPTTLANPTLD